MKPQRALSVFVSLFLQLPVHAQLVGHWDGTATVADSWAHGKTFAVVFDVHRDGTVTGTLGNAKLADAHWKRQRLSAHHRRKYPGWTTWLITGTLSGSLMPKDGINATYAYIPIERYQGKFSGGVNAHGTTHRTFFGTCDKGIMTCELNLRRRRGNSPNQAMQRTASKPATDAWSVCHLRSGFVVSCTGLAVADLVSR